MIDDDLLSRATLPDDEWSVTPRPEHLVPESVERERTREAFRRQLDADTPAVVLTHTDADGLTSAALLADLHSQSQTAIQPLDYHGAYSLEQALYDVLNNVPGGTKVYITDLCPDDAAIAAPLGELQHAGFNVVWYDHHQWDEDIAEAVTGKQVGLSVNTDECTASLLALELPIDAPHLQDLAAVTKDRDLWIREDPRSDRLSTFSRIADVDEYVDVVLEHGPDLPDAVQERIDERQARDAELQERAVARARIRQINAPEDVAVAITYTRGGNASEIGNALVEEHGHDVAVVMKPHGGASIYSHSNREGFAACHEAAAELGGGGHPTAAGCSLPFGTFLELADYWLDVGQTHDAVVLDAIAAALPPAEETDA